MQTCWFTYFGITRQDIVLIRLTNKSKEIGKYQHKPLQHETHFNYYMTNCTGIGM